MKKQHHCASEQKRKYLIPLPAAKQSAMIVFFQESGIKFRRLWSRTKKSEIAFDTLGVSVRNVKNLIIDKCVNNEITDNILNKTVLSFEHLPTI